MADLQAAPGHVQTPPGACDCHMHIYGDPDRYPVAPEGLYPGKLYEPEDYEQVMARLGLERVVVVQPTAYGKDNACTLDAVQEFGLDKARAVIVVDETATDGALFDMHEMGARGVRFHMLPGGALPWEVMPEMAARADQLGWHIQLQLDGRELPAREDVLRSLPGTLVIDHTAKFLEPVPPGHEAVQTLLRLLDTGRVWVKLSAPYETSRQGPPAYGDVGAIARLLIERAPERMVWASNWPHPSAQDDPPDDRALLDVLAYWCPDQEVRNRILADNPAALYGFA